MSVYEVLVCTVTLPGDAGTADVPLLWFKR